MGARKPWLWIILAVVALAVASGAFALRKLPAYADIATGYVAQQTCTCRFVSGRSEASCMADYPRDALKRIRITEMNGTISSSSGPSPGPRSGEVTASTLFGLFHATAVYDERFGCRLKD